MNTQKDYPYIRAGGHFLGSFASYVFGQVATARTEHAPEDAIFRDKNGKWHRWSELPEHSENKRIVGEMAEHFARRGRP